MQPAVIAGVDITVNVISKVQITFTLESPCFVFFFNFS